MATGGQAEPKQAAASSAAAQPVHKYNFENVSKALLAGGLAGGISRTAVAPLERLKILMQVQGNDRVYRNTWQGLLHMARTEGVKVSPPQPIANSSPPNPSASRDDEGQRGQLPAYCAQLGSEVPNL
eukprot:1159134-Pelagomonas_calceolata.AAC.2